MLAVAQRASGWAAASAFAATWRRGGVFLLAEGDCCSESAASLIVNSPMLMFDAFRFSKFQIPSLNNAVVSAI
jgi:hypothetical protein